MNGRRAALVTAGLTASIALVGCGSSGSSGSASSTTVSPTSTTTVTSSADPNVTLDAVVAATNSKMGALLTTFAGKYTKIAASADYPSTLVITYTFAKRVDPVTAGPRIAGQGPVLDAACKTDFYPEMKIIGVAAPRARFVWLNPDGTSVTKYDCAP